MQNYQKLALAALSVLAIPCAVHADATLYGFVSGGLESTSAKGNGAAANESKTSARVVDNNSRIGFKGNEDLGNGLKAIWQVESSLRNFEQGGVNDKGQSSTFATRNSFVGLQGSWGTLQLGNYDTAYKLLTDIGLSVMPNMATDQNTGGSVVYNRRPTRLSNSVHYTSPLLNGFKFGASYGVDEARPTASDGSRQNDYRLDLAVNYSNGGLQAALGYDREGDKLNSASTAVAQQNVTGLKATLSYTFASTGTLVGAGFERVKTHYNGSPDTAQNDWLIALSQPLTGPLTLKAGYAGLGKLSGASVGSPEDYQARQWFLGATYDLSKRTQLYAYGTRIRNHAQQNANFATNPIYSNGTGTAGASLGKGDNPQTIGLGMMVAF